MGLTIPMSPFHYDITMQQLGYSCKRPGDYSCKKTSLPSSGNSSFGLPECGLLFIYFSFYRTLHRQSRGFCLQGSGNVSIVLEHLAFVLINNFMLY